MRAMQWFVTVGVMTLAMALAGCANQYANSTLNQRDAQIATTPRCTPMMPADADNEL